MLWFWYKTLLKYMKCPAVITNKRKEVVFANGLFNDLFPNHTGVFDYNHDDVIQTKNTTEHRFFKVCMSKYHQKMIFMLIDVTIWMVQSPSRRSLNIEQRASFAKKHSDVTICFVDIHGLPPICCNLTPSQIITFANSLYTLFDNIRRKYDILKLETINNCYITVAGLQTTDKNDAESCEKDPRVSVNQMIAFAKEMIERAHEVHYPSTTIPVKLKIGIHTGEVTAGIIDSKFSLFGDVMILANKLENQCSAMQIHLSNSTMKFITDKSGFRKQLVHILGRGFLETYVYKCPSTRYNQIANSIE